MSDKEKKQIERTCDRDNFSIGPILTYLHEFIVFFLGEKGSDEKGYGWGLINDLQFVHVISEITKIIFVEALSRISIEFISRVYSNIQIRFCVFIVWKKAL